MMFRFKGFCEIQVPGDHFISKSTVLLYGITSITIGKHVQTYFMIFYNAFYFPNKHDAFTVNCYVKGNINNLNHSRQQ